MAIVNFFVVLLVLSATIAIALARSITNPINMIRDKLDQLRLGQRNEKLIYNRKDEIGSLVDQYNRTIDLLEDSVQRLQDAERINAWQDFAKQVAHEIKNPLTPMKLSIQHLQKAIVEKRQDVNQLASRVTNTLIEQIDLLAHIASEFSSFAKMPAPINEKLNLNELLTTGLDVFEVNQTISLTKKLPDEPLTVYADRQQLLRVFNNLIKNAIQAIPNDRKGEVNILLETTENNEFALVSVNDNGVGIPEEQKEKVFLPNFTTKSSGMGIGLSMAKNMIQEAGGQIWLNSTMGIGSTFYVKLPLFKQGEPTQPKSSET
ncbi:MAG: GHKL domain-containing protein [Sphingobacteriales bacterium]|nr:GHKL domain-containing protein [Sphingobacteriales bacterium]